MPRFRCLLFLLLISFTTNAQPIFPIQKVIGKIFVSKGNKYLQFINDTLLNTSINHSFDTASFIIKDDSLLLKQKEFGYTNSKAPNYKFRRTSAKILSITNDTVIVIQIYPYPAEKKPDYWQDTVIMINLELIKEPVKDFKYLKYGFETYYSVSTFIIDSSGMITYTKTPYDLAATNGKLLPAKALKKTIKLSAAQLVLFKDILSRSLFSRLPSNGLCMIDEPSFTMDILIGDKMFRSKACSLSWVHTSLLKYIRDKKYKMDLQMNLR